VALRLAPESFRSQLPLKAGFLHLGMQVGSKGKILGALSALVLGVALLVPLASASAAPLQLDKSFGRGGKQYVSVPTGLPPKFFYAQRVHEAIAPNGDIYASDGNTVVRINPSGELDPGFAGGILTIAPPVSGEFVPVGLAVDSAGRLVIAGGTTLGQTVVVLRYLPDGSLDASFGEAGVVLTDFGIRPLQECQSCPGFRVSAMALDADGRILVGGGVIRTEPPPFLKHEAAVGFVGRLDPNGTVDRRYGTGGAYVASEGDEIAVAEGLIAGEAGSAFYFFGKVRSLDANGAPAAGFEPGGIAPLDYAPTRLALDGSGRLLVLERTAIERLLPDGSPDPSFGRGGRAALPKRGRWTIFTGLAVTASDEVVLAGRDTHFFENGNEAQSARRRLLLARFGSRGVLSRRFGASGLGEVSLGAHTDAVGREVAIDARGRAIVCGTLRSKTLADHQGLFVLALSPSK
jgi:uncharacterized delta-60 repeat protein